MSKKNCKKGWSCGSSCINKDKQCRIKQGDNAQEIASKLVDLITRQSREIDQLSPGQKSVRTKKQAQFESLEDAQKYSEYHKAMKEIEESTDPESTLRSLTEEPWKNPIYKFYNDGELSNEENYKRKSKLADDVVNELMNLAPRSIISDLAKKGNICARKAEDRPKMCSLKGEERKKAFDERGRMIIKKFVMTDFKDPVTNQLANWRDMQPDHLVPLAKLGGKLNSEVEANYNVVHRSYNQNKLSRDWETVNKIMDRVSTPEGFEEAKQAFGAKQDKAAKLRETHKQNLDLVDSSEMASEIYFNEHLSDTANLKAFTKAVTTKRPFNGAGGRGVHGTKAAMTFLAKLRLGLEPTPAEQAAFDKAAEASEKNSSRFSREKLIETFTKK